MIREHDRVVLTAPMAERGLEAGDGGAVVHVDSGGAAFEVEFVTLGGRTAAVVTFPAERARSVTNSEFPHAREIVFR